MPYRDRAGMIGGGEGIAIGAECDRVDLRFAVAKSQKLLARRGVPENNAVTAG
jgi:hypothetical protein